MTDLLITLSIFDASQFVTWFTEHANYLFVFVFMMIESTFIPFPSEVVVPPAAYMAVTGTGAGADMNIFMVAIVATLGALCGAFINYGLSMWIGRPIVYRFADSRLGHACLIDRQKVQRAEEYFDRHGSISTFIGRLIPVIRQLISIPAGLARMNIGKFALYTTLGAGLWNCVLVAMGYILAQFVSPENLFAKVEEYNTYLTYAGYALGLVCVGIIVYNAFFKHKNQSKTTK